MSDSKLNPAQASVTLTYRNYSGPTLLRFVNGKPTSTMSAAASPRGTMSLAKKRESSEDINASPKSSSGDEEASPPINPPAIPSLDQQFKEIGQGAPKGKIAATEERTGRTRSTRSRQPTLRDEGPQLSSPTQVESEPLRFDEPMDSWSPPNKRRKIQATYGRKSSQISDGFKSVPALPMPVEKPASASNFSVPTIGAHSPKVKTRSSLKDSFIALPTVSDETVHNVAKVSDFTMPGDLPSDLTSSATSASEPLFDLPDPPKFSPRRSNSTSSLSSVDSIASLVLTQERKEALRHGEDTECDQYGGMSTSRCPLCHGRVDQVHLESFKTGRRLNIRDQQRFCQEHRHRDAEKLREKKRYPRIDWPTLTNVRIPNHITDLNDLLNRKIPSYYRDRLDDAMEKAKSRKGLQRYLTDGVVDIAKHGYYGPKGAKIMGRVIIEYMSDVLKQELKKDRVARAAGVGGYVNAVLVPELAVRLVMEDMLLENEEQAREVLSESSNVGILLNADDDENVTRRDEEDEG